MVKIWKQVHEAQGFYFLLIGIRFVSSLLGLDAVTPCSRIQCDVHSFCFLWYTWSIVSLISVWFYFQEGDIDFLSSDHSPSPPELKLLEEGDFLRAWGGISSLQVRFTTILHCFKSPWSKGRYGTVWSRYNPKKNRTKCTRVRYVLFCIIFWERYMYRRQRTENMR